MITVDTLLANPELRRGAGWRGAVTHCCKGHEYTPKNTMRDDKGYRQCRTCWNAKSVPRVRAWRAAQRALGC